MSKGLLTRWLLFTAAIAALCAAELHPLSELFHKKAVETVVEPTDSRALGARRIEWVDREYYTEQLSMFASPGYSPKPSTTNILYRNTYSSTTSGTTHTFTAADIGTAHADRTVFVEVIAGSKITGVTLGGNAMTCYGQQSYLVGTAGSMVGLYKIAVAAGTTADIIVSAQASTTRWLVSTYYTNRTDINAISQQYPVTPAAATSIATSSFQVALAGFVFAPTARINGDTATVTSSGTDSPVIDNQQTLVSNNRFVSVSFLTTVSEKITLTHSWTTSTASVIMVAVAFGPAPNYPVMLPFAWDWTNTAGATVTFNNCVFGAPTSDRYIVASICTITSALTFSSATINGQTATNHVSNTRCFIIGAATSSGDVGSISITFSGSSAQTMVQWYRTRPASTTPVSTNSTVTTAAAVSISLTAKNGGFTIACCATTTTSTGDTWSWAGTGVPTKEREDTLSTFRFSFASQLTTVDETKNLTLTPSTSTSVNLVGATWL